MEVQQRWGLTKAFAVSQETDFFRELDRVLDDLDGVGALHAQRRAQMLEWCDDPVDDLTAWIYELADR